MVCGHDPTVRLLDYENLVEKIAPECERERSHHLVIRTDYGTQELKQRN